MSGQKEDGKDEKNENPENSLSESNDKKNRREAILRRGQMNRLLEARTVRTGFIL